MTVHRLTGIGIVLLAALTVAGAGAASSTAKKQRVTMDQQERPDLHRGTWELLVWTPGAVQDDSGSYTWNVKNRKRGVRDGQEFERVLSQVTFTGRNGTFKVLEDDTLVSSGRGRVATGTWKMLGGTDAYRGVRGGGRLAAALGLVKPDPWRYEGFLTAP